jgi:Zn finger protein HypA/HybF involved in hydrogenase expression
MSAAELWLDGNALAGLLGEVFAAEMTRAERRCQSCGTRSALGAHRAYRGAGAVLRCPHCGDVAMRISSRSDRHVVCVSGELTFEVLLA